MSIDFQSLKVSGIKINYYFICKRKLWLFSKGITMENGNDRVLEGSVVHEESYRRENTKELLIDNLIRVDIINKDFVKEVKISSKMKEADKMQLLYYLYYLKQLGIDREGTINYVKEKKIENISLTHDSELLIEDTLKNIKKLLEEKYPPKVEKFPYCKKCSYFEYCYIREE
ncbi:CRISPR-associated protein Cas4 [Inconstantimicrobium porci]|uniref:CRISPR-associated exonuclease Cas4 n=1 Tax=Inconstantimicrobium porci TaxID=2652291 RepID=A0A7X2T268_9CLOT|nr:CRISPR-associated protein Cas4 [Inconstantimicrobium porci]MSR91905.1 CRISPR-associated protein Cas4 [Inconstantimicrobium porci]